MTWRARAPRMPPITAHSANGALFPPVIFVNGAYVQYGRPSERKLRSALEKAGARTEVAR